MGGPSSEAGAGGDALPVLIVGSGLAGYNTARELRKLDADTPLVIISRDAGDFYSKPMLSNALAGNKSAKDLVMKPAATMAIELNATVRAHTEVGAIDAAARSVTLTDGTSIAYRDLVLALGADPIRLPLEGDGAPDVLSVNDLQDYARFADALEGATTVAILGAGLIGCEFANDLLARGIKPVVIDIAQRPLSRLLPESAGAALQQRLQDAGVEFRFGSGVARVTRIAAPGASAHASYQLQLQDGGALHADLVLSAIGLRPRTALAEAAGLAVERGVKVDRMLQASVPHVYAVGDNAQVDGQNLPYVLPLMQQARALGATLAGRPTPVQYPAMPVVVKTPAWPTVVCPPAAGLEGAWSVTHDALQCVAEFVDSDGVLHGFSVHGKATGQRQALVARVGKPAAAA
jgi:rubredoxin-NAD+ reductase